MRTVPTAATRDLRRAPARAALGVIACLAALAAIGMSGCPDSATDTTAPAAPSATFASMWPNDDGHAWLFEVSKRSLASSDLPLTPIDQPLAEVSLTEVRNLLRAPIADGFEGGESYPYEMHFAGEMTTRSGVHAQFLDESFPYAPAGAGGAAFAPRWAERVALARPDLRTRLVALGAAADEPLRASARVPRPAAAARDPWGPELIHGYAWRLAAQFIGGFGDNDSLLAWKYLEADLRTGHVFRFRLLPTLVTDVALWASVEREHPVDVPGIGRVARAVDVLYLIDFGDATLTDAYGQPLGHFRTFDYGSVTYAPGVGPISVIERRFALAGTPGATGLWELRFSLVSTSPGSVAARTSSQ